MVFFDYNRNGLQDSDEVGVAGVSVKLYRTSDDSLIETLVTNKYGNYLFEELTPDSYYIEFTTPSGYSFSLNDQGSDDAFDSDGDDTLNPDAQIARVPAFTLSAGENKVTINQGIVLNNSQQFKDIHFSTIIIQRLQNISETGIVGVEVHLLDSLGNIISEHISSSSGYYEFTGLPAGSYQVRFVAGIQRIWLRQLIKEVTKALIQILIP